MSKKSHHSLPLLSTHATAVVSVALVLIILGIVGLLGIAAHRVSTDIRQQVGFVVMLADDITPAQTEHLKSTLGKADYTARLTYSSADDVMRRWQQMGDGGDDTELLGINPFAAEIEIGVTSEYADPELLQKVVTEVERMPGVAEVSLHADMVRSINATMRSLALVLVIVAAALLLISFVLFNNTVRLTVYARRFTIHTMKLVGAKAGFIRRPFIISSIINGIIAGLIALVALSGVLFYVSRVDEQILGLLTWQSAAMVMACVFVAGIVICAASAWLASNKYLRLGYDKMFA